MASGSGQPRYCTCGTLLARDNKGKRCMACQKVASQRMVEPPAVPASFWQSAEIAEALEAWHMGHVIRAYRLHEYHREAIPQAVVAHWFNLTQAQLSRIENGTPPTDLARLIPIAHTLGIPADLLWFKLPKEKHGQAELVNGARRIPPSAETVPRSGGCSKQSNDQEEDDMRRRTLLQGFLAGAGSALSASAITHLPQLEHVRQSFDWLLEGSEVGISTLGHWEALPAEYGQRYQVVAPAQLLTDVAADFVGLQQLLGRKQTTKGRITLCRVSSQLATLTGIFLAAQGDGRNAQNWFHTAGLAASEANDSQLAGLALVRSGIVSLYHGAPGQALRKLDKAQALLGARPTPWRARALVVEARSLARLGKRQEAQASLQEAETTFEDMPASALSDPALGYTERQFYFTVANAYTCLGMTSEAEAMQQQALSMYQPTAYLDPALIQLDQAHCLIRQGDGVSACQKAIATISAVPDEHKGLVTHYGRSFLGQLPHPVRANTFGQELAELLTTQEAGA